MELLASLFTFITLITKIAIIDTGINPHTEVARYMCADGHKAFDGRDIEDDRGHGTSIAAIIMSEVRNKKVCFIVIKYLDKLGKGWLTSSLRYVSTLDVQYINISLSGYGDDLNEYKELHNILNQGKVVVVAAGNDGANFDKNCNKYPACHRLKDKRLWVVGSKTNDGKITDYSNYGNVVNAWANGELYDEVGTSYATARWTANLINNGLGQARR